MQWLSNLFTLQYGPYFAVGFAIAWGWQSIKSWMRKGKVSIKWRPLLLSLGLLTYLYVTVQTQQNADCIRQFNQALRARAAISEDNDHWSRIQRAALGDWLRAIILPPPEIARLRTEDPANPRVQQWGIDITIHYSDVIQQAQKEQDDNLAERAKHPLPEPTCGKG